MSDLPTSYYVHSLIEILHYISDGLLQCDSGTTISELFSDDFDDLDFEFALTCFEGTHRLAFKEHIWKDVWIGARSGACHGKSLPCPWQTNIIEGQSSSTPFAKPVTKPGSIIG